ncbi:hypothetical protein HUB94_19195 [Paenibacillus cellulosilyticus]|nr:hypothetical protein HUB94_00165 [Paenibacillus cellulosilyticus]QKS43493.1 hypothetical protein HUB94_02830 [Paenibacillus cellulosilyticus]QKS46638.1 hypothetical protein HUB94_19195 [Paenibacillus cellulosilyticus]
MNTNDISPDWKGSTEAERRALDRLMRYEQTPQAVVEFSKLQHQLGDYWYWFTLSTLWVSYSGFSDLNLWRKLFRASRKNRNTSIMKPSEWEAFKQLSATITVYRAHRPNETDWISYTTDRALAERWATQRGGYVRQYKLKKVDCLALFLRRGENEIIMLNLKKARPVVERSDTSQ